MDHFLAAFGGVGGAVAVIGIIVKIWPATLQRIADNLFNRVDPKRLKKNSPLSQHFEHTHQIAERQEHILSTLTELQTDAIANCIMQLIHLPGDQSRQVGVQLSKLENLGVDSWVIPVARDYIAQHSATQTPTLIERIIK